MSNAIAALADYLRFYSDPEFWQQAAAKLPNNLKGALPTVEEIEQDLQQLQEGIGE